MGSLWLNYQEKEEREDEFNEESFLEILTESPDPYPLAQPPSLNFDLDPLDFWWVLGFASSLGFMSLTGFLENPFLAYGSLASYSYHLTVITLVAILGCSTLPLKPYLYELYPEWRELEDAACCRQYYLDQEISAEGLRICLCSQDGFDHQELEFEVFEGDDAETVIRASEYKVELEAKRDRLQHYSRKNYLEHQQ